MKFSVVVPTFNAAELLEQTLYYLSHVHIPTSDELEVIIVDDGSDDRTYHVCERYSRMFQDFSYIFRPRDQFSCRSRARNLGISRASGEFLIFMDAGMLLPPNFAVKVAAKYKTSRHAQNMIVLARMAGVFINPEVDDISMVNEWYPEGLFSTIQRLLRTPSWRDHRDPLFDSVNGNLTLLPAPWALGWSGTIIIPTSLARRCNGFDESFLSWGGEDSEFAYRLYKLGAVFEVDNDIVAVRVPRKKLEDPKRRSASNMSNVRMIHHKHRSFETEVYTVYPGMYYNEILRHFEQLAIAPTIPAYAPALVSRLNEIMGSEGATNLLVGSDDIAFITSLNITHVFVINSLFGQKLQSLAPELHIERALGAQTFYEDKFFDTVLVTDFMRTLGSNFIRHFCGELSRISKSLIVILSEDFRPVSKGQDGAGQWASIREIASIVQENGMTLIQTDQINTYGLFTINNQPTASE